MIQREPKLCKEDSSECSKCNAVNRDSHVSDGNEESAYSCLNRLDRDIRPGKMETRNLRDSSLQATPCSAENQNRYAHCNATVPVIFGPNSRVSWLHI